MAGLRFSDVTAGRVELDGELVFATVVPALNKMRELMASNERLSVDLKGLTNTDSSALALLLQLVDEAGQRMVRLNFDHLPASLLAVAKLSNATDILPRSAQV